MEPIIAHTGNPERLHRRTIRLQGYDYSKEGLYFITICTDERQWLLGQIENKQMVINDAGLYVQQCWLDIPNHFPFAVLHDFIVMPNHVHGIIELLLGNNDGNHSPGGNYYPDGGQYPGGGPNFVGVQNFEPLQRRRQQQQPRNEYQKIIPRSVGSIVRGFKIGVTKWFREKSIRIHNFEPPRVWQRNYYEHIIRDEQSFRRIATYIRNNPAKWDEDSLK